MSRLLYENSVSYKGYLIIPFVFGIADGQNIYSYALLSELGHKGKFHKLENPAGFYSSCLETIIKVAKEHLEEKSDVASQHDYFKNRYIYQDNLIIVYQLASKYFYDHYKPEILNNVAAPKIFETEQECINWIKEGLDKSRINQQV
ncbi:hypothetical protein [Coleofasciculus sp. FACHB-1120]|uniref:hypothetical protein n=1 Tax=Coleofasciculus sp. FACHB-1120 TaxID=2692783 RepID=UPI001686BC7B|nr:hypothetical protein [Coleofasciculus sp. FACHB-1120]MBD2741184.1 hypothetical protein [Coleofasciculus sp. FACHB-1120]